MATLQVTQFFSVMINGVLHQFGSLTKPSGIVVAGEIYHKQFTLAVSTTQQIYDNSINPTSWEFIAIASDFDVMVEYTTDVNNGVGDEYYTQGIRGSAVANQLGVANVLGRQASYGNYTVNFGGGTLDVIDRIRAKNLSASQAAQIAIFCVK